MSKLCEIIQEDGYTRIIFYRSPSLEESKACVDLLVKEELYIRRLWDMSRIDYSLTTDEIMQVAKYGKQQFSKPNVGVFWHVKDLGFANLRQLFAFRDSPNAHVMVYRDEADAIKWVTETPLED